MCSTQPLDSNAQEGFTLLEVLITVALLSIAFVGILSAVGGLVVSGAENLSAATVQAAVKNVAVFTQSFGSAPYFGCSQSPTALYQNDIDTRLTLPAGVTATVTNVQFWDGNTPAQFLAACPTIAPRRLSVMSMRSPSPAARSSFSSGVPATFIH